MRRHISQNDRTCANLCMITNIDPAEDDDIRSDIHIVPDSWHITSSKHTGFFDTYCCALAQYDSVTNNHSVIYNKTNTMKNPQPPTN